MERSGWRGHPHRVSDLRQRTAGHALIERLLAEWERGTIHLSPHTTHLEVEVDDSAESWYRGAVGERRVGEILSALPEGWTVVHSVPLGSGSRDIDHVVIGPDGVFTINTKYSPGRNIWARGMGLYVGGHAQQHIRKARDEAQEAGRRLTAASGIPVQVTGVVTFVQPGTMNVRPPFGDETTTVRVSRETALLEELHGPQALTPEQVERIVDVAARPETWYDRPLAEDRPGDHLAREFAALQQHVEPGHEGPKRRPAPARRGRSSRSLRPSRGPARPPVRPSGSRRGRERQRTSPLASFLALLVLAGAAFIGSQIWLHAHDTAPAPAVTTTVPSSPTSVPSP